MDEIHYVTGEPESDYPDEGLFNLDDYPGYINCIILEHGFQRAVDPETGEPRMVPEMRATGRDVVSPLRGFEYDSDGRKVGEYDIWIKEMLPTGRMIPSIDGMCELCYIDMRDNHYGCPTHGIQPRSTDPEWPCAVCAKLPPTQRPLVVRREALREEDSGDDAVEDVRDARVEAGDGVQSPPLPGPENLGAGASGGGTERADGAVHAGRGGGARLGATDRSALVERIARAAAEEGEGPRQA